MSPKICKRISRQTDKVLVEWLKTLIPEEDHSKLDTSNIYQYLPPSDYFYTNKTLRLSFYSPKWVRKNIKKLVKLGHVIEDINMGLLERVAKHQY